MTNVLVSGRVIDKQVGGNTRYARTIYDGLATHGVTHRIARPPRADGRFRSGKYALSEGVLWPLIPGRDVDVVHFPADTGALVSGTTPVVGTVHGLATLHVANIRSSSADRLWKARVARLVAVSKTIITVSHSSADDIVRLVPGSARKIEPIPHGIDHQIFHEVASPDDGAYLAELGIDTPYFLYLGNLDPRKNIIELCKAAAITYRETGIPLLISGAPAWDSEDLVSAVTSTPGVRYLGRVSDQALVPLIRGALTFCFPSSYEGFGFPVIEAMACGTPVICSDRGSLKEVAGEAALILKDIHAQSIADQMIRLANDSTLRAALRERGLVNAKRFQWSDSIRRHADVFKAATQ